MIWGATALLVILAVLFLSLTAANQARTSGELLRAVVEQGKQITALNKLVLDLMSRVEAIERAPKAVATSAIKPGTVAVVDSDAGPPSGNAATQRELGQLKAVVEAQGEKLDAVLEGLKSAEGSRRRRR